MYQIRSFKKACCHLAVQGAAFKRGSCWSTKWLSKADLFMQSVLRLLHLSHLLRSARTRGSSSLKLKSCFQPFLSGDDCYSGYSGLTECLLAGNSFHKVHVTVGQTWTEWQPRIINSDLWAGYSNDILSSEHCANIHIGVNWQSTISMWLCYKWKGVDKYWANIVTTKKMLENRPKDALGSLVKTVETVMTERRIMKSLTL